MHCLGPNNLEGGLEKVAYVKKWGEAGEAGEHGKGTGYLKRPAPTGPKKKG